MFKPTASRLSRRLRRTLIAGTAAGAVLALGATGVASASPAHKAPASSTPAVPVFVGPMLDLGSFGTNVALPLGCSLVAASVGSAGNEYNVNTNSLVTEINSVCDTIGTKGTNYLMSFQTSDTPLAALNPPADSVIGQAAASLSGVSNSYGDSLAPFGPTISGLGPFIKYFEGSGK